MIPGLVNVKQWRLAVVELEGFNIEKHRVKQQDEI